MRRILAVVFAVLSTLTFASAGVAAPLAHPDSDAPRGADPTWLPDEPWVNERWLPFDQARLMRILRSDVHSTHLFLDDGNRTLMQYAAVRGVLTKDLATRLTGPRDPSVPTAVWALRHARTLRVLTQGHLAAHMLEHAFHQASVNTETQLEFGVSPSSFQQVRYVQGVAAAAIAASTGLSYRQTRARMLLVARRSGELGVRLHEMSPAQASFRMAFLESQVDNWLRMGTNSLPTATAATAARVSARSFFCSLV